jgi:hypothetical protein
MLSGTYQSRAKKILTRSRIDAVKELSQRHLQSPKGFWQGTKGLQNNRARILAGREVTSTSKRLIQERVEKERISDHLTNLLMTIPDAAVLINKTWKTMELHLQYNDGTDIQ